MSGYGGRSENGREARANHGADPYRKQVENRWKAVLKRQKNAFFRTQKQIAGVEVLRILVPACARP